jgi:hypothetical protein
MDRQSKGITFFLEISKPAVWEFGRHDSNVMRRYWFGYFAFGWIKEPFEKFATEPGNWEHQK